MDPLPPYQDNPYSPAEGASNRDGDEHQTNNNISSPMDEGTGIEDNIRPLVVTYMDPSMNISDNNNNNDINNFNSSNNYNNDNNKNNNSNSNGAADNFSIPPLQAQDTPTRYFAPEPTETNETLASLPQQRPMEAAVPAVAPPPPPPTTTTTTQPESDHETAEVQVVVNNNSSSNMLHRRGESETRDSTRHTSNEFEMKPLSVHMTEEEEENERLPRRRLTADEEQAARFEVYRRLGEHSALDFLKETADAFLPSALTKGLEGGGDKKEEEEGLTNDSLDAEGKKKNPLGAAGAAIGSGVNALSEVVEEIPDLVVKIIPTAIMSEDHKRLIFIDFSNTMRSFFHTNILSMPFVLREAGLIGGIFLLLFVAFTSEYATEAYFGTKNQMRAANKVVLYGDVPRMVWGDWFPMINMFYGVTHLIGFLAFTASNARVLLAAMGLTGGGAKAVSLIVPSVIALPFVFMKRDRNQQPLSLISNTLVLTSVIMMLSYFPYGSTKVDLPLWPKSASNFFTALGVTVYAFTGIGSCLPIERSMSPKRYIKLLRIAVGISCCLLLGFGLCGYISYGVQTCSVMTVTLQDGGMKTAVSALLFVASLAIIPQQTFPLCELCDRRILGIFRMTTYFEWKPNLVRVLMLAVCILAAWIVPYYGLMLSISGSLGCGIVGIVVPAGLDYIRRRRWGLHFGRHLRWWEYLIIFGLGGYGCAVVVIGVIFGMYNMWITIQTNASNGC